MKVLVTGASGFLGKKLVKTLREKDFQVIITGKRRQSGIIKLDVTDRKNVERVLEKQKPEVVIHSAAITNVDWCENNEKETIKVNVDGTRNIAKACKKNNAKMVFISTDYVFDGKKNGKYTETDQINPINAYGKSKLLAEMQVKKILETFLILRVTALYGYNDRSDKKTFPLHIIETLSKKKEVMCFVDQYLNPTLINDLAEGICLLLKKNKNGVFHMTGSENLNRLEFAKKVAKVFRLNKKLLKPGLWENSEYIAKRPKKLKVSIEKAKKLGIHMSDATQGLLKMKKDMENHTFFSEKKS